MEILRKIKLSLKLNINFFNLQSVQKVKGVQNPSGIQKESTQKTSTRKREKITI